jgi:hypothetical protein
MSGMPFLAIARLAERSPIEFPQARIVMPSILEGILEIVPRNWRRPTRLLAMVSIQVAAMKKPYREITVPTNTGNFSSSAYRRTHMPIIRHIKQYIIAGILSALVYHITQYGDKITDKAFDIKMNQ